MEAKTNAGIFIGGVAIVAVVLSITLYVDNSRQKVPSHLRVGVGAGIAGTMINDTAEVAQSSGLSIDVQVFIECCGNASQWAMGNGEIDIGFFCSSIALTLINSNDDLMIYGPAVMNSEVVALGADISSPTAVAVPLKRAFLSDLIRDNYPAVTDILQASPMTIQYALADGRTESAVLDIAQALRLPDAVFIRVSEQDYISYSLVARREIVNTTHFEKFLEAYNQTAESYNDYEYMENRFGMSGDFWQMVDIKFLAL